VCGVIYGSRTFSKLFAIGKRSNIGLKEDPLLISLLGFAIGIIFDSFQICGMMLRLRARVNNSDRYLITNGPEVFQWTNVYVVRSCRVVVMCF